jgi:transcriptional regulator with PAS, ATPase and Fis domain
MRKNKPFVAINCGALRETLLESELFGYEKGSFTGANQSKPGILESARGGIVFLDEIHHLGAGEQASLLRAIRYKKIRRVGSTRETEINCRIVAAAKPEIKEMIKDGRFLPDLYFRFMMQLEIPALRYRREDIECLIEYFCNRFEAENGIRKSFLLKTVRLLEEYDWPGNVRELQNEIERLVVLSGTEKMIAADLLSQRIRDFGEQQKVQGVRVAGKLKDALEELEKTMILDGLRRTKWNKSRLAKELGISRAGLIMKVEKYGLDKRKLMGKAG